MSIQVKTSGGLQRVSDMEVRSSGDVSALSDLTDVEITSVAKGDIFEYDGTKWVNVALPTTIILSDDNGGVYYHAMRGNSSGMNIYIPLIKRPASVTGSNLQYYSNGGWNSTDISSWDYVGNNLVIGLNPNPSNMGVYGIKGTINITY